MEQNCSDILNDIAEIASRSTNRASLFQLAYFVVGREPTIQARLNRCVEELKIRKKSLEMAKLEEEEQQDNLDRLKYKAPRVKSHWLHRKLLRRMKAVQYNLDEIKSRIKGMEEECHFFVEAYKTLAKHEAPKNWDDEKVQLEYWSAKYTAEIRDRVLLQMPLDPEILRHVIALPDGPEIKKQVIAMMVNQQQKLNSMGNKELKKE